MIPFFFFFDSTGMIYMHWVPIGQTVNKEYYVEVLREFRKRFLGKRPALFKSALWLFHQDNAPVHNSILVTDYLTKMSIKTVAHPPYSPDLAPYDFWLLPKLRGCRYETIEEMKEAVRKVIDTLTQEDFQGAFQKLLERYNKCIATGGDYFEGDWSFMCVLSIKVPIRKKSGNLFNDPRIKAIPEEEQWRYYLTHSWWYKSVHSFPKSINLKVNTIAWLEFELVCYNVTILYVNHCATEISPHPREKKS